MVVEFVSRAKQKIIEGKEKKFTKIAKNMLKLRHETG